MELNQTKLQLLLSPDIQKVEIYEELTSTNTYLKAKGKQGEAGGILVVSERQTEGRGRMNRDFHSPEGGIYFSLMIRPQLAVPPAVYTVAAAVAVSETIDKVTGDVSQIKWVNDVLLHGKKVCGILTEGSFTDGSDIPDFLVIGIGINLNTSYFPPSIQDIATSLALETGRSYNPNIIVPRVINHLTSSIRNMSSSPFISTYRAKLNCIGKQGYILGQPNDTFTVLDVNSNGHLIVEDGNGVKKELSSGEVSLRIK